MSSGSSWPTTYTFTNSSLPRGGATNYLNIVGINSGGAGGVLGQFTLSNAGFQFSNGTQQMLTNTATGEWAGGYINNNSADAPNTWTWATPSGAVVSYGGNGVSPWGAIPGINSAAQWIWPGDSNSDPGGAPCVCTVALSIPLYPAGTNVTLTVVQATQTIVFSAAPSPAQLNSTVTVTLSSYGASGNSVVYTSLTTGVCTASGGASVNLIALGTCTIQANQAGNTDYAAATAVSLSFTVTQATQTIIFAASVPITTLPGSGTVALAATSNAPSPVFTFGTTSANTICTVSGTTVTVVGPGTCTLTVTAAAVGNYAAVTTPVTQILNITTVTLANGGFEIPALGTNQFQYNPSGTAGIGWTFSTGSSGVSQNGSGFTGGNNGAPQGLQIGFIQEQGSISQTIGGFTAGSSYDITFLASGRTGSSNLQTIVFQMQDGLNSDALGSFTIPNTAAYSSYTTGPFTMLGTSGTLTITGTSIVDATAFLDEVATVSVSLTAQVLNFSGLPASVAYAAGNLTLAATSNEPSPVFTFRSTTPAVCTVSGTTMTPVSLGICGLSVTVPAKGSYAGAVTTGSLTITGVQTIAFAGSVPANAVFGSGAVTLAATSSATPSPVFTFGTSSVATICTVSGTSVTLVGVGSCVLTVTAAATGNYLAVTTPVTQTLTITGAAQTIAFAGTVPASAVFGSGPVALAATSSATPSPVFTFGTSSVATICTVSGTSVTLVGVGSCVLTLTAAATGNYAAVTTPVTKTLTITGIAQTIAFAGTVPSNAVFGSGTVALAATSNATPSPAFTFGTSSVATICTVSGTSVTLVGVGSCVLTLTAAATGNYTAVTTPVTQALTITGATQTIAFAGTVPSTTGFGSGPVALAATSNAPSPSFTFGTTSASAICAVSSTSVTLVGIGSCVLTVTAAATGNYAAVTTPVTKTLTITVGTQAIAFAVTVPATVAYGSGPVALAATSNAPGSSFTYGTTSATSICTVSGTLVTLVGVGPCVLTLAATATANYTAATATPQTLTITVASQTIVFGAAPSPATYNTSVTVNASGGASGNPVTFTSATKAVCTTAGTNGATIHLIGAGTCTVKASQAGGGNYTAAIPVTQSFTVTSLPSGALTATAVSPSVGAGPHALAVGDFNGDGKLDIATANPFGADVTVLLGNGSGGFTVSANLLVLGSIPYSLAVGDFNGDGKPDIVAANSGSSDVMVLLGDGTGGFTRGATTAIPWRWEARHIR